MHVQPDTRPTDALSDSEVVAYLFKAVRAQDLRTAEQVRHACDAMFPDLPAERQRACFGDLAQRLAD